MVWMATKGENTLCTAIAPFEKGCLHITMDYFNGDKHRLYYNPTDTTNGASLIDRMKFRLYSQDELLGSIAGSNKTKKVSCNPIHIVFSKLVRMNTIYTRLALATRDYTYVYTEETN